MVAGVRAESSLAADHWLSRAPTSLLRRPDVSQLAWPHRPRCHPVHQAAPA
jgi:hypothetical protein